MKKLQRSAFAILLLTVFSSVTFAAIDYPKLKFIGFSENGKYLAFEESGEVEGLDRYSNYYYATTYYVNVAKNSFALKTTYLDEPPGMMETRETVRLELAYKKQVATKLKKLRIISGNTGTFAVAHFLSDWSSVKPIERQSNVDENDEPDQSEKKVTDYVGGYGKINTTEFEKIIFTDFLESNQATDAFFELTLIPTLAKPVSGCPKSYKFELTLKDNTSDSETNLQILQKDGDIVPEGRLCPLGYKIERIYRYQRKIAVFLNVFTKDLERPEVNMNYMVVTGVISSE
jgi:hypothetical protein